MTSSKIVRPETLFGLPTGLERDEAQAIVDFIAEAWGAQFNSRPTSVVHDLKLLDRFFNPAVQGKRLREQIGRLAPVVAKRPRLPAELFVPIGDDRGLVTPEGRVALECLEQRLLSTGKQLVVSIEDLAWANRVVADAYRSWSRSRLIEAVQPKGPLPIPAIAFALALLINGSVGESKALPIETEHLPERELSALLEPVIDVFVRSLRPTRHRSEEFRLRGGWILTESTRKLFGSVRSVNRKVWVVDIAESGLGSRLGRELSRHRGVSHARAEAAIDSLIKAYHLARPSMVSYGIAFERPRRTAEIREQFLLGFATTAND